MGTTTNLSLPYPADTDFVGDGYLNIQNLATGIDAFYNALTTYTPTFTNVTGGAGTFAYRRMGKLGFVRGAFSAGTATAAAAIQISLPTGWTGVGYRQTVTSGNDTGALGVNFGLVQASGTTVVIYGTAARGNWGAGNSIATVFFSAWLELA